ncbi:MAG: Hsp20/alpha crystallin family protein [Armatimonadetes bacterium]|nr:Hsp20/alpha crystallin family protein [Armatimonadota bacterium]
MSLRRWDPFDEWNSVREAMDQLFEETLGRRSSPARARATVTHWQPALEIFETEGEIVVRAELPGIDPKDVDITLTQEGVSIRAEVKPDAENGKRNYLRRELRYGTFMHAIGLPTDVDRDAARASFRHGILEVTLPKSERAKPRQVKVVVD